MHDVKSIFGKLVKRQSGQFGKVHLIREVVVNFSHQLEEIRIRCIELTELWIHFGPIFAPGARWTMWLHHKFTDRKVRGSNPTSASRLPLSRLGQPDSVTSNYPSRVEFTMLRCAPYYYTDQKPGRCAPRTSKDFQCLTVDFLGALPESGGNTGSAMLKYVEWYSMAQWLEREFIDRKVRASNPTSASRLPLSRLGQPDSIPTLVQPSGGTAVRQRKGATAERTTMNIISWHLKHLLQRPIEFVGQSVLMVKKNWN
ncbi:hypothetical protein CSKR_113991 [Clonorchis sinensis]|uniref:Uncharacterized protein n=1 Tax=Clonorchis sinensis TaxID=79923 RepID=A0A419PSE5_CLOSI|nr:hypothetical protein CSKR_113991 [Clonorchis sinensis]